MKYARVIVDITAEALDKCFTYSIPAHLDIRSGDMVRIPFGRMSKEGFVLSVTDETDVDESKIKPINEKLGSVILPELLDLASFMREKYNCTAADALRCMIPAQMRMGRVHEKTMRVARLIMDAEAAKALCTRAQKQRELIELLKDGEKAVFDLDDVLPGASAICAALVKKGIVEIKNVRTYRAPAEMESFRSKVDPVLREEQQAAADEIKKALESGGGRFLLYGVTGSGKTEVYINVIRKVIAMGRGAIILVPEIALTPQTVSWFKARFGDNCAVLHSRLSAGERLDEWQRIRDGQAQVVIGARSAVFAPVEHPAAIIIDEEHEGAYISEKHPRYDAREIAAERVRASGGVLVLGSATPSIQSFMRTRPNVRAENKYTLLELSKRANGKALPETEVVDMREELALGNKGIFSASLIHAMKECMAEGNQAILFLNRRGHSTFVSCRSCGYVVKCESCDVTMTYHINENKLKCHYCGREAENPTKCPACGSKFIKYFGAGTQKVEEEVKKLFPDKRVLRMDMDTTSGKDAHAGILSAFGRGDADILVGTQMIAKGLDFPRVTLVGVVAADTSLNLPDFRSAERTFQLITQVAGRAGRADKPGRVIIQTYAPDSYAIENAVKQDYRSFYATEVSYRKHALYPPYTVIERLIISSPDEEAAYKAGEALMAFLKSELEARMLLRSILNINFSPAPIKRLNNLYRYQILIKSYAAGEVTKVQALMEEAAKQEFETVTIEAEVNPSALF